MVLIVRSILAMVLLAVMTLPVNSVLAEQNMGTLTVRVNGFTTKEGELRIALYENEETYDQRDNSFRSADLPVSGTQIIWETRALPFGEYAIMLYHDKNNNHKMDKNFIGYPLEGYGFSNDAEPGFGPPYFSEAKFNFNQTSKIIDINLQ